LLLSEKSWLSDSIYFQKITTIISDLKSSSSKNIGTFLHLQHVKSEALTTTSKSSQRKRANGAPTTFNANGCNFERKLTCRRSKS
jgi:hypothetical protein